MKCPYCKEDNLTVTEEDGDEFQAGCWDCGTRGPIKFSREEAIEAWERIAPDNPFIIPQTGKPKAIDPGRKDCQCLYSTIIDNVWACAICGKNL